MREAAPQPLSSSVPPSPDWRARPAEPGVDPRLGAFPSEPEEAFEAERSDAEALTGADAAEALEMLLDRARRGPTVAEVHVPFCETKCAGCGCWQNEYRQLESSRYADAVVKEMAVWSGTHAQLGAPVQALRLGGGNPPRSKRWTSCGFSRARGVFCRSRTTARWCSRRACTTSPKRRWRRHWPGA